MFGPLVDWGRPSTISLRPKLPMALLTILEGGEAGVPHGLYPGYGSGRGNTACFDVWELKDDSLGNGRLI